MKRSKPISSATASRRKPRSRNGVAELRDLQQHFARAVMRPPDRHQRMQSRAADGRPMRRVASEFIKPNDRLTAFERLEIYNRSYWFRLLDCFYEDYRGLRAVLGDRKFERLTSAYLSKYPSHSFTLRNLGDRLVKFLEEDPRWTRPRRDLVLQMARLEWAIVEAFDNEKKAAVTADELLDKDPRRLRLGLQPYITLLKLDYPLDEYMVTLKKRGALRSEASNAVELSLPASRRRSIPLPKREQLFLAVHRHDESVYYKRLEPEAFRVLAALQRGATLGAACSRVASPSAGGAAIASRLKEWFSSWSALGWFYRKEKS